MGSGVLWWWWNSNSPQTCYIYIHYGAGRSRLVNTCKGSLWKQSQVAVIQKEESVVDASCTHCQQISTQTKGRLWQSSYTWPSAGQANNTLSLNLCLFPTNVIFRMADMFRSSCKKANLTFSFYISLRGNSYLLCLCLFASYILYNYIYFICKNVCIYMHI